MHVLHHFLLWYRALAPAIARLEFSDLLQTGSILVSSTTSRREILAAFAPTLPPRAWAVLEALDTPQGWCTLSQLIAALGLSYAPAQRTIPELDVALGILWEQALITDTDSQYK